MAATINDANHWLFQLANSFLFMSYLSKDVLVLRVVLMGAGLSFVLWGSLILKVAVDTVVWNAIFTVINAYRAAEVAWSRRPIKFDCPEHETLYDELFGPVGIGRLKFRMLMEQGLLRKIKRGTTYLEAGNEASNLTLIYSGTMDIISSPKDGRPPEKVGAVERMQFVESPQWANMQVQRSKKATPSRHPPSEQSPSIGANTGSAEWKSSRPTNDEAEAEELGLASTVFLGDDEDVRAASTVEVTFRATVDVVYFTWPLERLQYFLRKNPSLRAPVNSIVGADVASKVCNDWAWVLFRMSFSDRKFRLLIVISPILAHVSFLAVQTRHRKQGSYVCTPTSTLLTDGRAVGNTSNFTGRRIRC